MFVCFQIVFLETWKIVMDESGKPVPKQCEACSTKVNVETFLLHLCEICSHQCLDLPFEEIWDLL